MLKKNSQYSQEESFRCFSKRVSPIRTKDTIIYLFNNNLYSMAPKFKVE